VIHVFVRGIPRPQGSRVSFKTKTGKIGGFEASPRVGGWKLDVAEETIRRMKESGHPGWRNNEPLMVELDFILPRPRTQSKKIIHPVKRPDLDKLIRAILDALYNVAYTDDSQVVVLLTEKRYVREGESPGVRIAIQEELTEQTKPPSQE